MSLRNKHILLGISGSIAAYKAAYLTRQLREKGAEVRVLMTPAAGRFVTPLTFQGLSGQPVITELFASGEGDGMRHIELARWADLLLIAPSSASLIGKLAHGIADDAISTLYLASEIPTAIAPAMNRAMWEHPATTDNIKTLRVRGVHIWGPAVGSQACGDEGCGRMSEPHDLVQEAQALFAEQRLAGCRVAVTAGPTCETIDPVRYLSNFSSGKMGFALARAARELGADTTLISGPVSLPTPASVDRIDVVSAEQMRAETLKRLPQCHIFIACAAVADYRPAKPLPDKIKKDRPTIQLELVRNRDILSEAASLSPRPFLVGFAAETSKVLMHAKEKLLSKQADIIIANHVGASAPYGFDSNSNEVTALWHGGSQTFAPALKTLLARQLLGLIAERYHANQTTDYERIRQT